MEKEQQGIVIEVNNGTAKVKVARHGDCENCGACAGDNAMVLEVNNEIQAKKSQSVVFELKNEGMLKAAFIVYILPLLLTFIGVVIGNLISGMVNGMNSVFQFGGGGVGFLISIVIIVYYERVLKNNINKLPKITKIL